MDVFDYKVSFNVERYFYSESNDPEVYAIQIDGDVQYDTSDNPNISEYETIATVNAIYLMVDSDYVSTFDIFDAHLHEMLQLYKAIFDNETEMLKDEVCEQFDCFDGNILYLDRLEIPPEHRGNKLGLYVLRELIKVFGNGCSLVACKPFPIQFGVGHEDKASTPLYKDFTSEKEKAFDKLKKYWSKLGFRQISNTDYYAMKPYDLVKEI